MIVLLFKRIVNLNFMSTKKYGIVVFILVLIACNGERKKESVQDKPVRENTVKDIPEGEKPKSDVADLNQQKPKIHRLQKMTDGQDESDPNDVIYTAKEEDGSVTF
ncbi:hypothetical protein [Maribacter sp. 2307ULW6-5]|uniref:hypothetical protein n=1 Tax=Maribacter sp. 2307ULW6-5 TaxID=3386275 RepID=UPI0039BD6A4E